MESTVQSSNVEFTKIHKRETCCERSMIWAPKSAGYRVHCVVLTCPTKVSRPRNDWSHLAWTQVTTIISSTSGCNYSNSYIHTYELASVLVKNCLGNAGGWYFAEQLVTSESVRSCENESILGHSARGAWLNQSKDEALEGRHEFFITRVLIMMTSQNYQWFFILSTYLAGYTILTKLETLSL